MGLISKRWSVLPRSPPGPLTSAGDTSEEVNAGRRGLARGGGGEEGIRGPVGNTSRPGPEVALKVSAEPKTRRVIRRPNGNIITIHSSQSCPHVRYYVCPFAPEEHSSVIPEWVFRWATSRCPTRARHTRHL